MFTRLTIVIVLGFLVAALVYVALAIRTTWVDAKIAALSFPPSRNYVDENKRLPAKGPRVRVVMIGDSLISRWPAFQLNDQVEIINRGLGGETAAQLSRRFYSDAVSLEPDVILIGSGMNDLVAATFLKGSASRAVVSETAKTLLQLAQNGASSGAHVLMATIIPAGRPDLLRLPVWKASLLGAVAEVNNALRSAALPERITLIDFSAALANRDDRFLPDEYRSDTLHLNEAGYDRLTNLLRTTLKTLLSAELKGKEG